MGTYIIHFDDKPWEDLDNELYYRCKEIPWFSTTKTTISRLTPYTEDSAYAHGYTKAESKYREIRDELEKQAYQRGYETAKHECEDCNTNIVVEAIRKKTYEKAYERGRKDGKIEGQAETWVCVKKIAFNPESVECVDGLVRMGFDVGDGNGWSEAIEELFEKYTATEAIEKIRQYEQRQEEQITKGDVVRIKSTPEVEILVTYADEEYVSGIALTEVDGNCEIGDQYTNIRISNVEKTGKHYDIVSVLQKMKETDNG